MFGLYFNFFSNFSFRLLRVFNNSIFRTVYYLFTYDQEEKFFVSFNRNFKLISRRLLVRKGAELISKDIRSVSFLDFSSLHMFSFIVGSVPFLEHNDANRMLMSSSMQRQSLPLVLKDFALVRTFLDSFLVFNSSSLYFSSTPGYIKYFGLYKNVLFEENKSLLHFLNTLQRDMFFFVDKCYFLKKYEKSSQDTFSYFSFFNLKNSWLSYNSLLFDCQSTFLGKLSFGKNLFLGYLCWEGYNFEDAVVLNEVLITQDIFSSLHLKKYKFFLFSPKYKQF